MNISQLIRELELFKEKFGDLEVCTRDRKHDHFAADVRRVSKERVIRDGQRPPEFCGSSVKDEVKRFDICFIGE